MTRCQKNNRAIAIVHSRFDFSGFTRRSFNGFIVEFRDITPKTDLYGTGFYIEFTGKRLKDELESMFKLSTDLKRYLRRNRK